MPLSITPNAFVLQAGARGVRSFGKLLLAIALDVALFQAGLRHGFVASVFAAGVAYGLLTIAKNLYFIIFRPGE